MSEPINVQRVLLGYPKQGKTSLARELVAEDLARGHLAIIHDVGNEFPFAAPFECRRDYWAAFAAAAAAEQPMPSAVRITSDSADEAIELALELAPAVPHPITLVLDEMVMLDASGPTHLSVRDRKLQARRRKFGGGIAPMLLAQDLGVLQRTWVRMATDLYVFRIADVERLRELERTLGIKGLIAAVEALPDRFAYLHVQPGQSLADAAA
jgi:hypothetical protein